MYNKDMYLKVNLTPVPASRPRHSKFGGIHYSASHTQYQSDFQAIGYECDEKPQELITGLVSVDTTYHIPIPKSASKKQRAALAGAYCDKKIDLDNLNKLFWDEVLSENIINDDNQIVEEKSRKFWIDDPIGYTECFVEELE